MTAWVVLALLLSSQGTSPALPELVRDTRKLSLSLRSALDHALLQDGFPSAVDSQLLEASAERLAKRLEQVLVTHRRERPKAPAARRDATAAIAREHVAELQAAFQTKTSAGFKRARQLLDVLDLDFDDLLALK